MVFYDLVHGYQPFNPSVVTPRWVKRNLQTVFLPTSLAMVQRTIPRSVQLQGWTIESWLNTSRDIRSLAQRTLRNLKMAAKSGYIDVGMSAYSHAILPMLSDDLIRAQIILDYEIVESYIGKPTWFWPPEGAVDKRILKIVYDIFPKLVVVIPDKSIGKENYMGPVRIKYKNGSQKALVFSTFFKNVFMNAARFHARARYTRRPTYLPKELIFSKMQRAAHSFEIFSTLLDFIANIREADGREALPMALMRDWENAGSRKGLRKISQKTGAKDIGVLLKLKKNVDFYLPSQINWKNTRAFPLSKILPSSWEMSATTKDPYPFWQPNKYGKIWRGRKPLKRRKIIQWQELIKEYDVSFYKKVTQFRGLHNALQDKKFKHMLKYTFPAVHSCPGFHYFAKRSWGNYTYAENTIENIVMPALDKIKYRV